MRSSLKNYDNTKFFGQYEKQWTNINQTKELLRTGFSQSEIFLSGMISTY